MSSCAALLLHLLPEGFVRIRNFGFLANRKRATTLPLCFQLLGGESQTEQEGPHRRSERFLVLSQVWWADDGRRKTHRF